METKKIRRSKRKLRIKARFAKEGYRIIVYRSSKYFYAYILDQKTGKVIFGGSEKKYLPLNKESRTKIQKAESFGIEFAKEALKNNCKKVVFDRSGYLYHGRVKAFADGVRKGGLEF